MARRQLSPDEQTLWTALTRSVRPLRPGVVLAEPASGTPPAIPKAKTGLTNGPVRAAPPAQQPQPAAVLDSGWERRIRNGSLSPDMTIDLHGHTLATAHVRLNQALGAALARDMRILLVVTGKPPKSSAAADGSRRGAIRAEIGAWLSSSPYADRVASARIAHRRHGGEGAIYLILRRKK